MHPHTTHTSCNHMTSTPSSKLPEAGVRLKALMPCNLNFWHHRLQHFSSQLPFTEVRAEPPMPCNLCFVTPQTPALFILSTLYGSVARISSILRRCLHNLQHLSLLRLPAIHALQTPRSRSFVVTESHVIVAWMGDLLQQLLLVNMVDTLAGKLSYLMPIRCLERGEAAHI
jgi:hypothetical protein